VATNIHLDHIGGMGLSTIILGKSLSQLRREKERKFVWDNRGDFTNSFMHGNEEASKEVRVGAWRKQWWNLLSLLGFFEGWKKKVVRFIEEASSQAYKVNSLCESFHCSNKLVVVSFLGNRHS